MSWYSGKPCSEDARNLEFLHSELVLGKSTEYIEDMLFSEDEVFKALSSVDPSKACGSDLPGRLLKEAAPWLSESLVALFNPNHSSWGSFHLTGPVPMSLLCTHDPKSYQHCGEDHRAFSVWEDHQLPQCMSIINSTHLSMVSEADTHAKPSCWRRCTNGPTPYTNNSNVLFLDFSKSL